MKKILVIVNDLIDSLNYHSNVILNNKVDILYFKNNNYDKDLIKNAYMINKIYFNDFVKDIYDEVYTYGPSENNSREIDDIILCVTNKYNNVIYINNTCINDYHLLNEYEYELKKNVLLKSCSYNGLISPIESHKIYNKEDIEYIYNCKYNSEKYNSFKLIEIKNTISKAIKDLNLKNNEYIITNNEKDTNYKYIISINKKFNYELINEYIIDSSYEKLNNKDNKKIDFYILNNKTVIRVYKNNNLFE